MRSTWLRVLGISFGLLLVVASAAADVKLAVLFGDNMVLQQKIKVPVWGTAEPGEEVTVALGKQKASAKAGADGRWMVRLDELKAGGPFEMTVAGKNTIKVRNVLVGEVWVCSGQSNMEFGVGGSMNAQKEIAEADYPNIRHFTVQKAVAEKPKQDTQGAWFVCSPKTVAGFTAVGYFFGRELYKNLNVPIGLIHTSWGGTPAESWTSRPALEAVPECKPILDRWDKIVADYPQAKANFQKQLEDWQKEAEKAKAEGKPAPRKPGEPAGPNSPWLPSGLYNAMIAPVVPYGIAGAIWYQGESNADRAYQYRKLFPAMIQDWRKAWGQGDFPFFFVQLANFMKVQPEPSNSGWAELREAQTMTLSLPKTGMAVIIDIGEANDIHPKNKQDVGGRLARAAEKIAYGMDIVHSGPMYDSMKVEGNKIRLTFKHIGAGLEAKGGEPLKGFAIAGQDQKFVWADAKIDGDTVIVSSDKVQQPVAVRYAWADNPICNLHNKNGLPASPFRTDDWPGGTADKR